jgi:hypothetical protein
LSHVSIAAHASVQKRKTFSIRPARPDETMLESLQRRASLSNPGDRDALLANPDAIALPIEQIRRRTRRRRRRLCRMWWRAQTAVRSWMSCSSSRTSGRHGIGRRLVDHIAEVARLRAASFLRVVGNPHAEGFYDSCGFRVTGTVETRFGVGLAMRRPP